MSAPRTWTPRLGVAVVGESVDAGEYAAFKAHQAAEAAKESQRMAAQWITWAEEVDGDPHAILRAYNMAVKLMAEHGVGDWTLRIGNARRQDGSFQFRYAPGTRVWDGKPGTLTLSGPLMSLWTEEQQRETILHEIAHTLCPDDFHGPRWGWWCAKLGIEPRPCWDEARVASAPPLRTRRPSPRPWVGTCPGGHAHKPRTRKPTARYSCNGCSPGRFDENALITWTKEGT